jgi:hypothetical protein
MVNICFSFISIIYLYLAPSLITMWISQDLKKKPPKANDIFNLILSPKKCREIPSLREVIQSMADLDSGNMNRIKKAAFELMEKLKVRIITTIILLPPY